MQAYIVRIDTKQAERDTDYWEEFISYSLQKAETALQAAAQVLVEQDSDLSVEDAKDLLSGEETPEISFYTINGWCDLEVISVDLLEVKAQEPAIEGG